MENRQLRHLTMPCCGAGVVLKQSKLMTRFFAHARKGTCTTQPETAEHLLAKMEIAKAVEAAGWTVSTETSSTTPKGDCWTADVLACKGKSTVAIEVQWSSQTNEKTAFRQERYKQSNVRGLWLFRQDNFVSSKEIPAFKLIYNAERNSFSINVCDGLYSKQTVELENFIIGALNGALKFAPAVGHELPLEILGDEIDCWKCNRPSRVITHFKILANRLFKGFDNWLFSIQDIENEPIASQLLSQILPSAPQLTRAGIGQIKRRYSKTMKQSYISNGCVHCDSLFGSFYIRPSNDSIKFFDSKILLSPDLLASINAISYGAEAWWFDDSVDSEK